MHPVRRFRFVLSALLLLLALVAAMQGYWPVVISALPSSGIAALMAVGVHGTARADAEAARADAAWKRLPPWGFPGVDILIVLMLIASAWLFVVLRPLDPTEAVADLKALLPTLKEYRVTGYYASDGCTYFAYEHGSFIMDPDSDDCDIDVWSGRMTPSPRDRFDRQASADLNAIYAESERLGPRLEEAFLDYGADGEITRGALAIDSERYYVYEPGWKALPDWFGKVTPIDRDWYVLGYESD